MATLPERLARWQAARFGLAVARPPLALRSFSVSGVWFRRQARSALREWALARLRDSLADAASTRLRRSRYQS